MTKFIKLFIIVLIVLALAFVSLLTATGAVTSVAGVFQPAIGWNSRVAVDASPASAVAAFGIVQPCVGWNT